MAREVWSGFVFIAQLACTVSLGIGAMSLIGYASGFEHFYRWSDFTVPMALPTAIAITANAFATFTLFEYVKRRGSCKDGKRSEC